MQVGNIVKVTKDEGCDVPARALGQLAVIVKIHHKKTSVLASYDIMLLDGKTIYVEGYHVDLVSPSILGW